MYNCGIVLLSDKFVTIKDCEDKALGNNNNNTNESGEISLGYIMRLFLSKLWIIILLTIIGGAAAFCFSKFVLPLKYSSHITMYVQSYTGIVENPASSYNNISNSKQLVNTYMEVLKDDAVMKAVGEELINQFDADTLAENFGAKNGKISPGSIRACLGIRSIADTSAIKVTATTKNAEVSAAICNDLTKVAPDYVEQAVGVGSINTIDTAKVYNNPVAPNKKKNTILGALASAFLTMLVIFLIDFFDNSVKDVAALGSRYKKAIIGEIQLVDRDKKPKNDDEDTHVKLTDKDVPFAVVESYKSIRTNISFALSTTDKKVFIVSSPNPGDGKSTTAAFIIVVSALIASSVFDLLNDGIRIWMLWASIAVSVMTCLASMALVGAYSRLWRYFNKKDYLSCVIGMTVGIGEACVLTFILHGSVPMRYAALHWLISVCGVCTFRFLFKRTFIDLMASGRNEAKYKRTMMIGGGQACKLLKRT